MNLKAVLLILVLLGLGGKFSLAVEPSEEREWTSDAGTSLSASAISLDGGMVVLKSTDGRQLNVPIERLSAADRAFLEQHFQGGKEEPNEAVAEKAGGEAKNAGKEKGGKASYSGRVLENIPAGEGFGICAYVPVSAKSASKPPVFCFVGQMDTGTKLMERLKAGSEVTGWVIVVSTEMKGKVLEEYVAPIAKGWLEAMRKDFPGDSERIFAGAYGSGVAGLTQLYGVFNDFQGVLAVVGAFDSKGARMPVTYGMVGLGSNTRVNFCKSFEQKAGKGSLLRFTDKGRGDVDVEEYEDGMIFLAAHYYSKNGASRVEEVNGFAERLLDRVDEIIESDAVRAFVWLQQSKDLKMSAPLLQRWNAALEKASTDEAKAYLRGLEALQKLAFKEIARAPSAADEKANRKIRKELDKLAEDLKGTKWLPVLESYEKDN